MTSLALEQVSREVRGRVNRQASLERAARMPPGHHLQSLDPRLRLGGHSRGGDGRRLGYSIFLLDFFTGGLRGVRQKRVKNSVRAGIF